MADVRVVDPTKDTALLRRRGSTGDAWGQWKQAGEEEHNLAGYSSSKLGQHVSLIHFLLGPQLVDVRKVLKAQLHVFTAADHENFKSATNSATTKGMKLVALKRHFFPDDGGEASFEGTIDQSVPNDPNTNYIAYGHIQSVALHENVIDVMPLVRAVLPDDVLDSNNKPGLGRTNYGWLMTVSGSTSDGTIFEREWVTASKDHVNAGIRPFLTLEVELKAGPGITVLTSPNGDVPAGADAFLRGEYEPGADGDIIKTVTVHVRDPSKPIEDPPVWTTTKTPDSTAIETSTFAVKVDPAPFKPGVLYEWTARVTNQSGDTTPYALPKATIRFLSAVPTLSTPSAPTGTLVNLLAKPFQATWTSATQRASVVQVQLRRWITATDPTWDEDLLWDSGRVTVPFSTPLVDTTPPPYVQKLSVSYGGPLLPPGTYAYRMQAKDKYNAETDWMYGAVTLTAPYVEQPGGEADLTQYRQSHPNFRIAIYGMGANRAPGSLLAELTDAANVGASEYFNSGGEFYFTLPAIHPQVAVIEPYQVHYSLDFHTPEGWRPKAFGLITDFDATEDEVIFYGMDYPAILARMVDERFDPTNADLPTDKGGAKYVDKSIDYVIKDQLNKARLVPNSPLAFITVGDVPVMPEKVTIYASFQNRLPFIAGLIDSYRAGTGRKTRIVCERNADNLFKWRVLDDPGIDRDNLRMEYGGLVQGFRTVPFSGWGTAVNAIGRTVLGTKVYADRAVAPGISEATYGAWPTTTMYQDIDDLNDLRRRTKQAAAQVAKVGKLMGIGIRVGSLGVKDMWDICDSVPIDIKRGVVDTSRFGSGYWTIWGWNWQSYPDGHSDLNLTLAPRQDTVAPNPDLIPSKPILDTPDFATGVGPPDAETYPPVVSMSPFLYLDVESGEVYEKNEVTGEWEVTGSLAGPEGPPGPEGPEGPPGSGTGDGIAPPVVTIKSLTAIPSTLADDGTVVTALLGVVGYATPPVGLTDLSEVIVQSTRFPRSDDPSQPDWAFATQWNVTATSVDGSVDTTVNQPGVLSAEKYWWRATVVDFSGNRQLTWSDVVEVTSATDDDGPPLPTGVVVEAGMSTIGVRWDDIPVPDLSHVEVQWREQPDGNWSTARVDGTLMVITGLVNDITYDVRVRSVDTSGNTLRVTGVDPEGNPTYETVEAIEFPDAGWVDGDAATPSTLPGSALVWDEAIIAEVFAGMLSADWLVAGTLRVGSEADGQVAAIEVVDALGALIGRWSTTGIEVLDPANAGYRLLIDESSLRIFTDADTGSPIEVVTLTPLGIDAASITFGSARGGHNLILNSSFELGAFGVSAITNQTWSVAADWNAAGSRQGADTNITTGANALTMTTI